MKGKQLAILLVLVVVIGGASWFLQKGNRSSWSETGAGAGGKVVNLPLNDVTRIVIKTGDGEVNLVRKDDNWTVAERADYPANFEKVSDLLRKVWDLKTVQDVKVGPSQFTRLDLIEPGKGAAGGTFVEFKDKDNKRIEALLLGKKYLKKGDSSLGDMGGFPAGRYVMPAGKAKVSLVSETFEDAVAKPDQWLKRDFIKIETPKSITLAGTTDAQHWTLARENAAADWKLADAKPGEELDKTKVSSFGTIFSSANFNDVLAPGAKPADTGLDKPAVATIETTDNFTYKVKIGKLKDENYPVTVEVSANLAKERTPAKDEKPEDKTKKDDEFKTSLKKLEDKLAAEKKFEGRPYLVAKWTIDSLLKDRAALLVERKPELAPAPPATSSANPPSALPPAPKIEAVTPPVSVPPPSPPKPAAATPAPPPPPPKPATATPAPPPPPPKPASATPPATPSPDAKPAPQS